MFNFRSHHTIGIFILAELYWRAIQYRLLRSSIGSTIIVAWRPVRPGFRIVRDKEGPFRQAWKARLRQTFQSFGGISRGLKAVSKSVLHGTSYWEISYSANAYELVLRVLEGEDTFGPLNLTSPRHGLSKSIIPSLSSSFGIPPIQIVQPSWTGCLGVSFVLKRPGVVRASG